MARRRTKAPDSAAAEVAGESERGPSTVPSVRDVATEQPAEVVEAEEAPDPDAPAGELTVGAEPIEFVDQQTGKIARGEPGDVVTGRMGEKAAAKALAAGLLELS